LDSVLDKDLLDSTQLSGTESQVSRKRDVVKPKLGRAIVAVDVDVRRLVRLVAMEVYPVRARTEHRG
jgi:hypothetical protein